MANLFTAVSAEQQEIVAGGGDGLLNNTFTSAKRINQMGSSISNLNGSQTGSGQSDEQINTAGLQIALADFPVINFNALPFENVG